MDIQIKSVIDSIHLLKVDVRSVGGYVSKTQVVRGDVFTDGSVRYIDPAYLRPFQSARVAAMKACRNVGTRFLGNWAIQNHEMSGVIARLEVIAGEVKSAKDKLLADYSMALDELQYQHPDVLPYKERFPKIGYVTDHVAMEVAAWKMVTESEPVFSSDSKIQDGVTSAVKGLPAGVLAEIAQDVTETWKPGRDKASSRIKNLLQRVIKKLNTLSFLGGNLGRIASMTERVLQGLPQEGMIEGDSFVVLSGLLSMLSSPEQMILVAEDLQVDAASVDWASYAPSSFAGLESVPQVMSLPNDSLAVEPLVESVVSVPAISLVPVNKPVDSSAAWMW